MKKLLCLDLLVSAGSIYSGSISANNKPTDNKSGNNSKDIYKKTWIDFNAGVVADGERTLDEAGADLYQLVLDVASGKQTCAEKKGFREISIFKDGVVL